MRVVKIQLGRFSPTVSSESWVADSASIIGRVKLAPRVGVFYGAVLRAEEGTIEVGAGTNLQDCCIVHADPDFDVIIGKGVTVGHGAIIHGCTLGDDVMVGMGAVVLNGAVIGAGSLIAAKALITESAVIPSGSLVTGVPGKVSRQLTAREQQDLVENARRYEAIATLHASGVATAH